jgi:NAD(P)-dependent dehydrogenase (short-subunit alcohol dehydrogenase family)
MPRTTGLMDARVIVTGAGSGIGRAAALQFADEGARVVVADVDPERADAVVAEIVAAGGTAIAVAGDVSDQSVVDRIVDRTLAEFGGIDVLVNNAGIMDAMTAPDEVTDAEWERVLRINLTAPFLLTRAVAPHMLAAGKGAIVNTASEAAVRGSAAGTPYTVSKHGVVGLTRSAAVMYRARGIRVNAVAPGGTSTNLPFAPAEGVAGPGIIMGYLGSMGRMAEADEVAAAIVFLASDLASDISGAVLPVDAGWSVV